MRNPLKTMCATKMVGVQGKTIEQRAKAVAMPNGSYPVAKVQGSRVALLSPYDGGNFGDAAIQDAVIANLRLRLNSVHISGISLNSHSFLERHGADAFPLCGTNIPFYGMCSPWEAGQPDGKESCVSEQESIGWKYAKYALKSSLRKIPGARRLGKKLQRYFATIRCEVRHTVEGYRFLRSQELLIVSGGGQLDDEWGGPWGHPYCLFKWAVIAKFARIPFAIASVGAGKTSSPLSRFFLSIALRFARYRSYRDVNSRSIAAKCLSRAEKDSVVPDLAFSLPSSVLPPSAGIRLLAQGRPIVALSPIAYAKAGGWPIENQALYERYKRHLAQVVSQLVASGYFLVLVWSSAGSDDKVVSEILACLDDESKASVGRQIYIPKITSWKELAALLDDVDFLIASRLHSTILGFMTKTPTVAISFDPKVDWLMQDLGQTDYLLQISNFVAEDVIQTLDRLTLHRENVVEQIAAYRERISPLLSQQYDALVNLVPPSQRELNWEQTGF
jgi:polysaccharide pyruvyl transferase WcaK-like protein